MNTPSVLPATTRWLKIGIVALFFLGAATFLWTAAGLIGYPYDLMPGEGTAMRSVHTFLETGTLYATPAAGNAFTTTPGTPLYQLVVAVPAAVTGLSFGVGRAVSFTALVGVVALLFLLLREEEADDTVAGFFPLLVFGSFLALSTGLAARPTMLGIFLSLFGLYLYRTERYYAGTAGFLLALFTGPVFIAGFLSGLHFLLRRSNLSRGTLRETGFWEALDRARLPFTMLGLYVGSILLATVLLEAWSGAFLESVVLAIRGVGGVQWGLITLTHVTLLPLFGLALLYTAVFDDHLFGVYFLASLLIGFIQLIQGGATMNVMAEPFVAALLCVALLYKETSKLRSVILVLLILQIAVFFVMPLMPGTFFDRHAIPADNALADDYITATITPGDAYTGHPGYAWDTGGVFPPEPDSLGRMMAAGTVSAQEVDAFFRQRNYSRIIVSDQQLDMLPIREYLVESYRHLPPVERRSILWEDELRVFAWRG